MEIYNKLLKHKPDIMDINTYFRSAVFLPITIHKNEVSLLFEVRAKGLKGQPGEICFPGGRIEMKDISPKYTAIRETCEELGIAENQLFNIAPLDILITPHQMIIYPFVGEIKKDTILHPNNSEVDKVFHVPLQHFIDNPPQKSVVHVNLAPEEKFPYHLVRQGKNYPWRKSKYPVYFYLFQEYIIWGLTARILHNFIKTIN